MEEYDYNQAEEFDIFEAFEKELMNQAEGEESEQESDSDSIHNDMTDIKYLILGLAKKMKGFERDMQLVRR
jgi:hypothetical protein